MQKHNQIKVKRSAGSSTHKNKWRKQAPRVMMAGLVLAPLVTGIGPVFADSLPAATSQTKPTGTEVGVDDTALQKAVSDAKASGMTITQGNTTNQSVDYSNYPDIQKSILTDYQTQANQINQLVAQQNAQNTQYAAAQKAYEAAKAQYDSDLANFNNGTSVNTILKALTQSYTGNSKYNTFMTANVDQQTGDFTLMHDMNDGVSIIGNGVLKGKFNWHVKSNGDGSEVFTVDSVTLDSYTYTNKNQNTAVNKDINFHVYDNSGKELFSVTHDGDSTFTKNINANFPLNETFTLTPGPQSDMFKFLTIDDNWVYNTHGQVFAQFENTNKKPTNEPTPPTKPAPLTSSYKLTDLWVKPDPTKDVDLGENAGDKPGSDNGKKVVKGQELTYALNSTALPANRLDDITNYSDTDVLPQTVDYKATKIYSADGKTDLTNDFAVKYDAKTKTVTVSANADYMKTMNADKSQAFVKPIVDIYAVANADNATIANKYTEKINNDSNDSNTVKNTTPSVKPQKQDLNNDDQDINGQDIKPGTIMNYHMTWDLSRLKDVAITDDMLQKGLSFSDDYDQTRLNITARTKTDFTIVDTTTKNSVAAETTVTWDDKAGSWTVKANDPKAFLQAHAGHQLTIVFKPVVKDDATGTLLNTAVQNDFGQAYQTQTVKNIITPNPKVPSTPNTSYGERPAGALYVTIAALIMTVIGIIFRKPIERWIKQ